MAGRRIGERMTSGHVRAAGLAMFAALVLCALGGMLALDRETLRGPQTSVGGLFSGSGPIVLAMILLAMASAAFALLALRAYLNRYAGFARADILIRSILICFATFVAVGALGFALGGGSIVLMLLGVVVVVAFVLYFALGFRLKSYAKEHADRAARIHAVLAILYGFAVLATVFLAMVAAAAPQARPSVSIAGWAASILQLLAWLSLSVFLLIAANRMRAKGM